MHDIKRRALLKGAAAGALAFTVGGAEVLLTPRAARAQGVPLRTLSAAQAGTLDQRATTNHPGAPRVSSKNSKANRIETGERCGGIRRFVRWKSKKNSEENS
jgi:hypothetical protein